MINKRLIAMMKDSTKYVLYTVLLNWIGLVFNIIFVITISGVIQNIYEKKRNWRLILHFFGYYDFDNNC